MVPTNKCGQSGVPYEEQWKSVTNREVRLVGLPKAWDKVRSASIVLDYVEPDGDEFVPNGVYDIDLKFRI